MANDKLHFQLPAKTKTWTIALMAIGVLSAIVGWLFDKTDHHQYWWANLLICTFFFLGISLGTLFFYALQYAAEVAWSAVLKRVLEAISSYVFVGFILVVVILLAGQFHIHHLYHWMDPTLYDVNSPNYDILIANKRPFLSGWFFWLRVVMYGGIYLTFAYLFRKWSLMEDKKPDLDLHYKQFKRSALFLVLFAFTSSILAWDWLMTIDTHWFSTMYGWYIFSGMWNTSMTFATLLVIWLKKQGYLQQVNDSHIHDMGKWVFATSMLWSYLWICQYLLIWYSNIPEEVTYFQTRYEHYMWGMWLVFAINFALPFYALISRDSKRNVKFLTWVGVIIFISHFFDIYMAVVPGTIFGHLVWGLGEGSHTAFVGWFEIGMFLGFLGLFLSIVLKTLTKAPLIPLNHPYLDESEHHHI